MRKIISLTVLLLLVMAATTWAQENETNETEDEAESSDDGAAEGDAGDESDEAQDEGSSSDDDAGFESDESETASDDYPEDIADDDPVDQDTEEEIKLIAESTTGAQIRILQLQRAVLKQKISAETIAGYIEGKEGVDSVAFDALIAELEALYQEAKTLDPASETRIEDYVYIKNDAKDISREFREAVRDHLSFEEMKELRILIKEAIGANEELAGLHDDIRSTANAHNAERVRNMLNKLGDADEGLIEKVKNGAANRAEVAERLKDRYQSMTPEEKREARQQLNQGIQDRIAQAKEKASQVRDEFREKAMERLEERAQEVKDEYKDRVRERLSERIETMEGRQETMNERRDASQERVNERIDARQERIADRIPAEE